MRAAAAIALAFGTILAGQLAIAATHNSPRRHPSSATTPIAATGTLGTPDLIGITQLFLKSHPDAFHSDPTERFVGRHFHITQYVKEQGANDERVDSTWSYDKVNREITFSLYSSSLHVMFNSQPAGTYTGRNAFGVSVRIHAYRDVEVVLKPAQADIQALSVTVPADPNEGLILSNIVYLAIDGSIADSGGSVEGCDTNDDKATIDDPVEEVTTTCSIAVNIDRVAFVDPGTGQVLKELTRPSPSAPEVTPAPQPSVISQSVPIVISQPDWLHRPSGDDIATYYPERASRMGVSGYVTMRCTITAAGTVTACEITAESPPDQEFGSAALRLARLFKMAPMTSDGVPVAGNQVIIPIGFQLPRD
ncbi:MAG TPA: TonB family protein [Caulobacteraceae bacterium]|jgi:TonB family protein|nr:TonB family protein [Caulobacteraceae bacterium]